VSFPCHFLVRASAPDGAPLIIDPFDGRVLPPEDLQALWEEVTGQPGAVDERALLPACRRQILARMLNNLRAIYEVRGDGPRLCQVLARLAVVNPCPETQSRLERAQLSPPPPRISIN
jgi:regulator of sirC expression with transglutaminase-like and TPR domain